MTTRPILMVETAVRYTDYGFQVYPLIQGGKVPHKNSSGHLDASNNPEAVTALFNKYGVQSNIGISLLNTEYVVIDIDRHQEETSGFDSLQELEEAYAKLPDTYTVNTPRNGEHRYYRIPGLSLDRDIIDFRPGIDILGTKVNAAPSETKQGLYSVKHGNVTEIAELPKFFIELMVQHDKQKKQSNDSFAMGNYKAYGGGKGKTIQLLEEVVQGIESGNRNAFFTRAFGTLLRANMNVEAAIKLMIDWNTRYVQPSLGSKELHSVLKSVVNRENKKRGGD